MGAMARIARWLSGPRNDVSSAQIIRGDGVFEALGGGTAAPSEQTAMAVSAIYGCVTLISGAISALPMTIYKRSRDGDLERDPESPLWWMLNEEFCPRWAAASGWSFIVASKLLHGDGFAEILRDRNGGIRGVVPLHPQRVRVFATPDGARLKYEIQPDYTIITPENTAVRILDQDDILHIPGFGFNGLRGLSPLKNALRVAGNLAVSSQDFSASFIRNMGRPDYALKSAANLTDEQFSRLREMLNTHTGPMNSGKPMILEGGLDVHPLTMPLEEMQLLEMRKFQVEEIARIYGVPPFMIGHTEKTSSWGTGVSAMGAGFVRFALRDHLNAFQNEINRKFFRTASRVAEFDTTELERADIGVLTAAIRQAIGRAGEPQIMSVEEARHILRLPRKMAGAQQPEQKPEPQPEQPDEGQTP